jgi:hypothetical protein
MFCGMVGEKLRHLRAALAPVGEPAAAADLLQVVLNVAGLRVENVLDGGHNLKANHLIRQPAQH